MKNLDIDIASHVISQDHCNVTHKTYHPNIDNIASYILIKAIKYDSSQIIEYMFKRITYEPHVLTLIFMRSGRVQSFDILIEHNMDINYIDTIISPRNKCPILIEHAMRHKNIGLLKKLLNLGVSIGNIKSSSICGDLFVSRYTPKKAKIIQILLDHGLNINRQIHYDSVSGGTPLTLACEIGHYRTVKLMLQLGADPNYNVPREHSSKPTRHFPNPLMAAISSGRIDIINLLIEFGADPNLGTAILEHAIYFDKQEIVHLLVNLGVNLDFSDYRYIDDSPLLYSIINTDWDLFQKILSLIKDDNYFDRFDRDGDRFLHYACRRTNPKIIEALLKRGSDVSLENDDGKTPLDVIMQFDYMDDELIESVRILLEYGATPSKKTIKKLPELFNCHQLFGLFFKHHPDLVSNYVLQHNVFCSIVKHEIVDIKFLKLILSSIHEYCGSQSIKEAINSFDENGQPALYHAVSRENYEVCKILLQYGADPHIACKNSNTTIISTLRNRARRHKHGAEKNYQKKFHRLTKLLFGDNRVLSHDYVFNRAMQLVIMSRIYDKGSLFHEDNIPNELFLIIFKESVLSYME